MTSLVTASCLLMTHVYFTEIKKIHEWASRWLVSINTKKTLFMYISRKPTPSVIPLIYLGNATLS